MTNTEKRMHDLLIQNLNEKLYKRRLTVNLQRNSYDTSSLSILGRGSFIKIFSFSKLHHPNCGMEIVSSFYFYLNSYIPKKFNTKRSYYKEKKEILFIIGKFFDLLMYNYDINFTFQNKGITHGILIKLGWKPIAEYSNLAHSSDKNNREILAYRKNNVKLKL